MNEKDLARYWAILNKNMKGQKVSKEDTDFFIQYMPYIDEGHMKRIIEQGTAEGKWTADEVNNAMQQMTLAQITKPEYKQKLMDFANTKEAGRMAGTVRNALNTALSAVDIGMSAAQISGANRALRRSQRPNRPAPLTKDPTLQAELESARQGTLDTARALAPAQQELLDTYRAELNQATTASTGQAGVRGALGQAAAGRRARGAQQLVPMADTIRAREQARVNDLLRMNQAENAAIQQSQAQFYPTDMLTYMREQEFAGNALAQGRQNLRAGIGNVVQSAPDAYANHAMRKRMDDVYNKLSASYGPKMGELAAGAYGNLDPSTQQSIEEMYNYQFNK